MHTAGILPTHTDYGSVCIQALFGCRANLTLVGHFATHTVTALPTHTYDGSGGGGGSGGGRVARPRHCYLHPHIGRLPCQSNTTLLLLLRGCRAPSLHYIPQNSAFLPIATLLYAALRLCSCSQHSFSVPLCVCYSASAAHTCFRHIMHSAAVASRTPPPVSAAVALKYSRLLAVLDAVLLPYVPPTALMHSHRVGVLLCLCHASTYSLHLRAHLFVTCDSILRVLCRVCLRRRRVCPFPAAAASLLSLLLSCDCCGCLL